MAPSLAVLASLALGATVSTSRLGVEVAGSGSGLSDAIAACPRALKVAQPFGGTTAHDVISAYANACSGGTTILELPEDTIFPTLLTAGQGQTDAGQYWDAVVGPGTIATALTGAFTGLGVADLASLRWIAGPANFFTSIANPNASPEWAAYANGFMSTLATLVRTHATTNGASYALLVPEWRTSAPGAFCQVVGAARTADTRVAWSFRATSLALASSTSDAAFAYRDAAAACGTSTSGLPLFVELTATGGWFAGNRTATQLVEWLGFVDAEAAKDADVAGGGAVLLRAVGGGGIDDLLPAIPALATYLRAPSGGGGGGGGGTPPGGVDGGTSGGTPTVPPGGGGGRTGGCGLPADGASLAALALLAAAALRRRR